MMSFRKLFVSVTGISLCHIQAAPLRTHTVASSDQHLRAGPAKPDEESAETPTRAKLEIHYETLCPYCSTLIGNSLRELWEDEEFRERIDVALFPAGNVQSIPASEVSEGYKFFHPEMVKGGFGYVFQCQHGDQECLGNMVQSCVMKVKSEPEDHLPVLFCMEQGAAPDAPAASIEKVAFDCMQKSDIDPAEVLNCTQTAAANEMMYRIANYSNSLTPQRQYVPWVTIDGDHYEEADAGDLLGPLCRSLSPPLPAACDEVPSGSSHQGIVGKIGHWFGGLQEKGAANSTHPGHGATFCYP